MEFEGGLPTSNLRDTTYHYKSPWNMRQLAQTPKRSSFIHIIVFHLFYVNIYLSIERGPTKLSQWEWERPNVCEDGINGKTDDFWNWKLSELLVVL